LQKLLTLLFIQKYLQILFDDPQEVACHYIKGAFAFDLITSIPGSLVDYFALQSCVKPAPGQEEDVETPVLKLVRLLKPLRLLKMGKIFKMMNLEGLLRYVESRLHIPHEIFRMILTVGTTFGVVHVCACAFWMVKENTNTQEDVDAFLDGMNVQHTVLHKYVLCCYFIVTVCTTVGFGDIGATNTEEQLLIMCIMFIGAIVFANLMNNVQMIKSNICRMADIEEEVSSQARNFLRRQGIPPTLERRVLSWLDFDTPTREEEGASAAFLRRLPNQLLMEVMSVVIGNGKNGNLEQVSAFKNLQSGFSEALTLECFSRMQMQNYYAGDSLAEEGVPCTRLLVILKGQVCIEHIILGEVYQEETRGAGDYLGEWSILGDQKWAPFPNNTTGKRKIAPATKTLNIVIISGRGLRKMDVGGLSDPYVSIHIDEGRSLGKTRCVENTLTPYWNEQFKVQVSSDDLETGKLVLRLWDRDLLSTDENMGQGDSVYVCARERRRERKRVRERVGGIAYIRLCESTVLGPALFEARAKALSLKLPC
jgi:hypothetical protein